MLITRKAEFSASHVCSQPSLSEEENRKLYGEAANPRGHGHNYVLEVSVSGPVDPATGMIANLADLDIFVEGAVLQVFDHKSLNEDVPAFHEKVPTTENLCIDIYERLKSFSHAKLERVRIEETRNNSFEYAGEEFARVPAASAAKKEQL